MSWFDQREHFEFLVAGVSAAAVLGVGGAVTDIGPWYAGLRKPSWQPPGWLFAPAWTLIFALAAFAGVKAWDATSSQAERVMVVALFALNGVLNIAWSMLFFKLQRPDWALIEVVPLWLSVLALVLALAPLTARASVALLPYLAWVAFAGVLNRKVVRLNAPFRRLALL